MVLKWVTVLFCSASMLMLAWAPVAYVVNGRGASGRERIAAIVDHAVARASVSLAFQVNATAFPDPRPVPPLAAASAAGSGLRPEVEGGRPEPANPMRQPRRPPVPRSLAERPYASLVEQAADRYGVDPRLVHALIEVESGYRADAVSSAGAMGLMQLMPATAEQYNVADPLDPESNIEAGTRHLRALLDEFGPLIGLDALAAYHAGGANVRHYGGFPPYPQTHRFVRRVLDTLVAQGSWGGD